ncbi:hypothetical protein Pmani_002079 [Petrolisthes manimaculis]|uniref:Glutathione peroxidase n=1 Tax=Petrolisthes manimaculis TaxID=1843537 RepID=A0AAE1UKB6_9EUCA|nr:hypothetical protein Pmani_002467 [Petrolisthes manimaculis]KAK4327414.1 hypothetical protein Pmani_002079 [Petrolisthes manimaculis]
MSRLLPLLMVATTVIGPSHSVITSRKECGEVTGDLYQFSANTLNGSQTMNFEQFRGKQEPGVTSDEIYNGIRYVRPGGGFEPLFTLFEKVDVNGENENPIFTFLKSGCEYTDTDYSSSLFYSPLRVGDIHWNFEKFLVDRTGKPFTRYHPSVVRVEPLMEDINLLLNAS